MSETTADHHPLPLDEEETVDAVPVIDEVRAIERTRAQLPAVKTAAAVAATSFVAGAATVVAISHHARKRNGGRLLGGGRRRGKGADALPIVATRSVLLDIHLLGRD
ncbi:hypothetical protein [Conexibacter sp. CPCC 206217]|uniref:hypothetical protein n=1 Tax=Conexibacter sp. CPCC 206217 TaxID=3064574 RepID=UPI0027240267|nr:hypothetical protein [Conexibacter sp. CPCC 206217]MDO8209395.1 hypothetical protein [Conexibacter sp. CPCC 206217]